MKDRLITLFGGLAALYVAITLLTPPAPPDFNKPTHPLTNEAGDNGLLGLKTWLEQGGVPIFSLRRRYDVLAREAQLAATGNLLIVALPQLNPTRESELEALKAWLEKGNNALILVEGNRESANESDVFLWGLGYSLVIDGGVDNEAAQKAARESVTLQATGHPVLVGVSDVEIDQPIGDLDWRLEELEDVGPSLMLLRHVRGKAPAFWETSRNKSRIWISAYRDLFSNRMLGKQDNARLIANLISASLGAGGKVIFDDMHQGLSDLYDPEAFFKDARLHNTLWFLLGFWLLYLLGHTNRIAPPATGRTPPRAADFIHTVGGFFARRLTQRAAARALYRHFFNEIRARCGLPLNGQPVWERLASYPRVDQNNLRTLRAAHARLDAHAKQDLITLTHRMHKIRNSLL
jgi:hypothetical protein